MTDTKIDSIVNQVLLEKGLPVHFYVRLLSFGLECLKELELDAIGKIKSVSLPVDEFSRIKIPCDYVDWVRVGQESGQYVLNMGSTSKFNRKLKEDNGIYTQYATSPTAVFYSYYSSYFIEEWLNEHGEVLGGLYGGNGTRSDEFMVLKDEGVIQLNRMFTTGDTIDLDYLSFSNNDSSALVPKYAESTVKAFIEMRYISHLPKAGTYDKAKAVETYDNETRKFYARMNELDAESVKRIRDRRFMQAPRL